MVGGYKFEIEDRNMYSKNIKKFVKSAKKFIAPSKDEGQVIQLDQVDLNKKHVTYNFTLKKSDGLGWRNAFLAD